MAETAEMTDLQFKSRLKQIIRDLEGAEEITKEETDRELDGLLRDLKEDLRDKQKRSARPSAF